MNGKTCALAVVALHGIVLAQPFTGKEIFQAACIGCHGPDGKGMPQTTVGFTPPSTFPDFTDCGGTTREPNADWRAIIHQGGPVRGFSEIMPSFTEALLPDEIEKVIQYLRTFCLESSWPRGELNFPRALITDKAFPEDESVITTTIDAHGFSNDLVYEKRFGIRNQVEAAVPVHFARQETGTWLGGVGDITLGYKRVLGSSLQTGSIFSFSGEVTLPTGNRARGLGSGVTIFETFATYGQMLPQDSFLQFQGGVELPTHLDDAARAVFWRTAVGKKFTSGGGSGRLWSPMVELLADRKLVTGEKVNWDVVPQIQITLSKRQHIRFSFGVRFPVNQTSARSTQAMLYLLWDRFDGGLREGWR